MRERREDLPALCKDLLGRICRESGFQVPEISAQVLASLQAHPFQGNVRELENILHRAVALGEDGALHLESPAAEYVAVPENLQAFLDGKIRLSQIAEINRSVMLDHETKSITSLATVLETDEWARSRAIMKLGKTATAK